jgi:sugar phosphate isomerase/epimerase
MSSPMSIHPPHAGELVGSLAERITLLTAALPNWGLERALPLLRQVGISSVELVAGPGTELPDTSAPTLHAAAAALDRAGVRVCGVAAPLAWRLGSTGAEAALTLAAELGASFVRVYAHDYDGTRPAREQLDATAAHLDALRTQADGTNVQVLLETSAQTVVPSPELARHVIDRAGPEGLGVVYDPGNMLVEGHLQPSYAVSLLGSLLGHVHAKNQQARWRDGRWCYEKTSFDRGQVNWSEVADALRPSYTGLVSIDHLSGTATAARLKQDLETLRALVSANHGEQRPSTSKRETPR